MRSHPLHHALVIAGLLATTACGSPGLEPMIDQSQLTAPPGVLHVDPAGAYEFGDVSPEAGRQRGQLLLWIDGGTPVRVTDIYLDGTTSSAYSLPSELPVPVELQPGDAADLGVFFKPYAAGSFFGDVVFVMVEDGEERELTLALEGQGCVDADSDGVCD